MLRAATNSSGLMPELTRPTHAKPSTLSGKRMLKGILLRGGLTELLDCAKRHGMTCQLHIFPIKKAIHVDDATHR
jgi:hypothetical protein